MTMKIILDPTLKEFVMYLVSIFPCFLIAMLLYFVIRCYSYEDAWVLIPITACIVVLYTFFNNDDKRDNTE
ncbi:hypothetical protein SAMN02745123_02836 [Desulforamulus aeronauticus DSM 10349]|uniref:Uncharacterized protein n=1 Tax=Desulforamulus aeronauticus DSM 10349 TaxID=1121421 RepID=A0A1M6UNB1_9FIRM|nr:hypothetical protein SAMN02745123_02836 [Desulforamulus aeronauticus DSM 10349]